MLYVQLAIRGLGPAMYWVDQKCFSHKMLQKNLNDLFGLPNTFGILQNMDVIEGRRIHKISQGGDGGEGKKALKN